MCYLDLAFDFNKFILTCNVKKKRNDNPLAMIQTSMKTRGFLNGESSTFKAI